MRERNGPAVSQGPKSSRSGAGDQRQICARKFVRPIGRRSGRKGKVAGTLTTLSLHPRLGHTELETRLFVSFGPMVDAALENNTERFAFLGGARGRGRGPAGKFGWACSGCDPGRGREATPVAMATPWWRPQSCLRLGL